MFISCEKADPEPEIVTNPKSFSEVFEVFWNKMNSNYVYWDVDPTNWDQIYYKYKAIFADLDLNDHDDVIKSVGYFKEITKNIIDGHYLISFTHNSIDEFTIQPLYEQRRELNQLPYFYSYLLHDTVYLDPGYKLGIDYANGVSNNRPLICVSGTINKSIIYFSCNYFGLTKSSLMSPSGDVNQTLNFFFNLLKNVPVNTKGIIIDVRGNPGGDLMDLNYFLGHLIEEPLHIGYSQYKRGYGRKEFTPWIKAYVNPQPEIKKNNLPIVILADRYSASLSETVVMAVKSMPSGIHVGEQTWGATGPLVAYEVYNSGSFEISGFMKVQTSSCKFRDLNNVSYESKGIEPNIYIPHSSESYEKGIDDQLEKAIELFK